MRRIPICILRALILAGAVGLPSSAQEQSVKPGINQNFQNPNPAEFIKRFERAGRDIYDYREKIVEACGLQPGTDIADVGAGTGLFSRLFAQKVGPKGVVRAVDISDEFVAHITNTCAAAGITNVIASVCASDDIGLPPDSTDVAFVCDTYHHLEFPQKTLRSIHRALREHGRLVVIDFERIPGKSSQWILDHVRAGKDLVRKEIESAGFHFGEEKGFLRENYLMVFEKPGP
ncbi:MAG TPA: methyltransferase domain-containing protein [Verrucomicrobiae bacterium]|nr:methyltransferase domain-containing protein [Verrucomicrobiae bacterium]